MTTTVKIEAHCADTNQVSVVIHDGDTLPEAIILQDGETAERYVYDGRVLVVMEVEKPA